MLKHPTCSCVFVRVVLSKRNWCLGALARNFRGGEKTPAADCFALALVMCYRSPQCFFLLGMC